MAALLCALAAVLALGSGSPGPDPDRSGAAADPAEPIARELGRVNPELAGHERARAARAVLRCAERHDLDPTLVTAVILVESSARPWVESPKGAVGLMQVMPHMMEALDLPGSAATIESNIAAGCLILADNIRRLGERDGISAYFWGSRIRGVAYLERVQAARAALLERSDS